MPKADLTRLRSCLLTLVITLLAGCGGGIPLYQVEGFVEFENGNPVRNASIEFVSQSDGPSPRGRIDREGKFQLSTFEKNDGAPKGTYNVIVVQALAPGAFQAAKQLGEEHESHKQSAQVVAMKHARVSTTGIEATIESTPLNQLTIRVENQ